MMMMDPVKVLCCFSKGTKIFILSTQEKVHKTPNYKTVFL